VKLIITRHKRLFDVKYILLLLNIYRLIALRIACVLFLEEFLYELMNVSIYYKISTILLQHCGNYFPENYQFTLSGPWQVFSVATYLSCQQQAKYYEFAMQCCLTLCLEKYIQIYIYILIIIISTITYVHSRYMNE